MDIIARLKRKDGFEKEIPIPFERTHIDIMEHLLESGIFDNFGPTSSVLPEFNRKTFIARKKRVIIEYEEI